MHNRPIWTHLLVVYYVGPTTHWPSRLLHRYERFCVSRSFVKENMRSIADRGSLPAGRPFKNSLLGVFHCIYPGMLILVLVLKDSLRTFFKFLSWSLGVRSLSLSLGVRVQEVLVLVLVLGGQVLVLILVLVVLSLSLSLVFTRTCFHYSIIPIYSHNILYCTIDAYN